MAWPRRACNESQKLHSRVDYLQATRGRGASGTRREHRYGLPKIAVTEQTYYRWRKEYGGMGTDQLKRLKELEKENARLRRAVADLSLEKIILAEAAKGNF